MKTGDLTGPQLDWAVAKCEGVDTRNNACVWFLPFEAESDDLLQFLCMADDEVHAKEQCEDAYPDCTIDSVEHLVTFKPSSRWSQGGPIIEREHISTWFEEECPWYSVPAGPAWGAGRENWYRYGGPTPLIAAMRCYVASKLGPEIEIPQELI